MNARPLFALAALLAVASQATAQTYDLGHKPKKGTKTAYTLTFNINGQGQTIVYKAKISNEVVEVKEDGSFLMAMYQSEHQVSVGGVPQQTASETITSVTGYDRYGKPVTMGGDDTTPNAYRTANLTSFIAPVAPMKVGESWKATIVANRETGAVAATHNYMFVGTEKQNGKDVAVIEFTVAESTGANPASAKGKVWIDLATGETVRYEADVKAMPNEAGPVSGKVVMVRV